MANIPWAMASENVIGRGHPILADVANRAIRFLLSISGYDPDAVDFPGLLGPVFNGVAFGMVADNGVTDNTAKLLAATTAAAAASRRGVVYVPGHTSSYGFSSTAIIPANVSVVGASRYTTTFAQNAGFTGNHAMELRSKTKLSHVTVDGTNGTTPVADWLGVNSPVGSAVYVDGVSNAASDIRIADVTFQNFKNGAVFTRNAARVTILRAHANTVQTVTTVVRSAAFELYQSDDSRLVDCEINGYTMKGYNLGALARAKVVRSHAYGGAQDIGHAAHYMDGCSDCTYVDCNHEGTGFGFKANNSLRPRLVRYTANGSAAMAYFQGCTDFLADCCNFVASATSKQAYIVQAITVGGTPQHSKGGTIRGGACRRSVQGTTTNHEGVDIIADATAGVYDLTVTDVLFENFYITAQIDKVTSATCSGIVFDNVKSITPGSYSYILFSESVTLRNCTCDIGADGKEAVSLYSQPNVPASLWDIIGLRVKGMTSTQAAVTVGLDGTNSHDCKVTTLNVRDVRTDGGTYLLRMDLSNTAGGANTNFIKELNVERNHGRGLLSATAMTLVFATTQATRLSFIGNKLHAAAGGTKNVVITDTGTQVTGVCYGNDVNAITGKPAALTVGL